jgi:phosphatidylglycerophosphatase C
MRIAVFDLDGTLTRHDTLLPYLQGWRRRHPRSGYYGRALGSLCRYLADRDRGRLKSALIRAAMSGATRDEIDRWTAEYVGSIGMGDLCAGALAAVASHRAAGDRLVLLSASVDLYVPHIGRRFAFDETICTEVAWLDGRLDGGLVTDNRRGEEKRRCIDALRARHPGAAIVAYGNARSDFAHFAAADSAVLVNAGPRLRREAERRGYRTEEWRVPSSAKAIP